MVRWSVMVVLILMAQPALRHPDDEVFTEKAPENFRVILNTTKGDIVLAVYRSWSPTGVDRFFHLV